MARKATDGAHRAEVDHRKADDPYESRYGDEEGRPRRELIKDVRTKGYGYDGSTNGEESDDDSVGAEEGPA